MEFIQKMKKFYLIIPILALLMTSCKKDGTDEIVSITPTIKPPEQVIQGSIMGQVLDEEQLPIPDASVGHLDDFTTTDDEGLFSFTDIELFEDGSLLTIEKDGYIKGSKKFYASDDNVLSIQLSPKTILENTSSSEGGRVDINEAFIILPSGGYETSENQIYSGDLRVFGKWLNPAQEQDSYEMPGDLTGYDELGELKALICFSMLKVGIEDNSEDIIQLTGDQTAIISFPIPQELLEYAPEEISLWYYDEANGSWIEDGVAILVAGRYEGEVSHISVWACGISQPVIEVSGSFNSNGVVLGSKKIKLIDYQSGYRAFSTTNEKGHFTAKMPAGINLNIEIENECSNLPLKDVVGILTDNEDLGPRDIESDGSGLVRIKGTITDCSDNRISSNSFLKIEIGDTKSLINIQNGEFDFQRGTSCADSEITVVVIDPQSGAASELLVRVIDNEIDFGNIKLCESIEAGYYVDYGHMDWFEKLDNEVHHSWGTRTILSNNKKTIFNPSITSTLNNDIVYLSGAFVIVEDSKIANYLLRFETQGFSVSGTCEVQIIEEDIGINSYRFSNNSQVEITFTDSTKLPVGVSNTSDIGNVEFDLVYYD